MGPVMKKYVAILFISLSSIHFCFALSGEFIDSVQCQNAKNQYYSIYIPKDYHVEKKTGVIFFFEPAGRASLPLKLYSNLAEKHNVILACSWNSRNGPLIHNHKAAKAIIEDVCLNYKIDSAQLFLSGFSGGARFSYHYASHNSFISGVIACGAGLSHDARTLTPFQFNYSIIIGASDFNYREVVLLKDLYHEVGQYLPVFAFSGDHKWPSVNDYERALIYQLHSTNNMVYDSLLTIMELNANVNTYHPPDPITRTWNFENIIQLTNNTISKTIQDSLKHIKNSKHYAKEHRKFVKLLKLEDSLQAEINQASYGIYMTTFKKYDNHKSMSWWRQKIKYFRKLESNTDLQKSRLGTRLLGQIMVVMWEGHRNLMREKFYDAALERSNILLMLYPDNPSALLLKAETLAAMGKQEEARAIITSVSSVVEIDYSWKLNKHLKNLF